MQGNDRGGICSFTGPCRPMTKEITARLEEIKKDLELDGSLGTEPYHLGYIGWLITELEQSLKREAELVEFIELYADHDFELGNTSGGPAKFHRENCNKCKALTRHRASQARKDKER